MVRVLCLREVGASIGEDTFSALAGDGMLAAMSAEDGKCASFV